MEKVKRSRKSAMKKRPEDWEALKTEIAKELGLWDKVAADGWSGLSAADSGRLGGVFAARKRSLMQTKQISCNDDELLAPDGTQEGAIEDSHQI